MPAGPLPGGAEPLTACDRTAELTRAKVLWIPSILLGADYIRHDGGGPDFNKGIMTAPSVNFFYAGPSLYHLLEVLGKEKVLARIDRALAMF